MPAGDVEGAVLDHIGKLIAAPELVARTWATATRADEGDVPEREVTTLVADFAAIWSELFPAERARVVQLLVERVDVAEGLAGLVAELRQHDEEIARAA